MSSSSCQWNRASRLPDLWITFTSSHQCSTVQRVCRQENRSHWIRWFAVLAPGTSPGCSCAWLTSGWYRRPEKQRWRRILSRTTAGNEVGKTRLQAGCQTRKGGIIGLAVQEFWSHVALCAAMLQWSGRKADEEWHNYITRNCAGLTDPCWVDWYEKVLRTNLNNHLTIAVSVFPKGVEG